jgi:hypothetical protein
MLIQPYADLFPLLEGAALSGRGGAWRRRREEKPLGDAAPSHPREHFDGRDKAKSFWPKVVIEAEIR